MVVEIEANRHLGREGGQLERLSKLEPQAQGGTKNGPKLRSSLIASDLGDKAEARTLHRKTKHTYLVCKSERLKEEKCWVTAGLGSASSQRCQQVSHNVHTKFQLQFSSTPPPMSIKAPQPVTASQL